MIAFANACVYQPSTRLAVSHPSRRQLELPIRPRPRRFTQQRAPATAPAALQTPPSPSSERRAQSTERRWARPGPWSSAAPSAPSRASARATATSSRSWTRCGPSGPPSRSRCVRARRCVPAARRISNGGGRRFNSRRTRRRPRLRRRGPLRRAWTSRRGGCLTRCTRFCSSRPSARSAGPTRSW